MAEFSNKKRKHNDDGSETKTKKSKVAAESAASSQGRTIKVSSVVQPRISPPVVGKCLLWLLLMPSI